MCAVKYVWLLCLASGLLTAGCADGVPEIELADRVARPSPGAVIFWVDGLDIEIFRELQQAGTLPNITEHFVQGGVGVERAVVSYPTITYANSASFVTGQFPGHHGITGNRWFDRYSLIFKDYTSTKTYRQVDTDFVTPTIYEMLHQELTATITVPLRRGATRSMDNWMSLGPSWFFEMHETSNQLSVLRLEELGDLANQDGRWPRLIFTYFPTTDFVGHKHGPDTEIYQRTLIDVDHSIGQFLEALRRAGLYETTYRVLVTDHGFLSTPPENLLHVERWLRRDFGIPVEYEPYGYDKLYEDRQTHFGPARMVVVSGGNRRCSLHLRVGDRWDIRPTPEQIDSFLRDFADAKVLSAESRQQLRERTLPALIASQPAVDLVCVREGPDAVRVQDASGVGRITRQMVNKDKRYRYEVVAGRDPLGYVDNAATALVDGEYHASREWLAASVNSERPDAVPQLMEMFDSPRTGDVIFFAQDRWAFIGTDRGGHGGLVANEILVPLYFGGPDLPGRASIPVGRTVDLTPTVLGLLGMSQRYVTLGPSDGVDLSSQLREAAK